MSETKSYSNPAAFRRALTDKLRNMASASPWSLQQLQRQFAYDRLLERLYLIDNGWIVKGATALLARDIGVKGTRIPVAAYVGSTVWAQFHVDLVGADLRMTGQPEDVPPIARVLIPDVEQHGYVAYPLVDHIADKVAATFELYGEKQMPSTRYRDLVDLVAMAANVSVSADQLIGAVMSEMSRREIALPERFDVPDRQLWGSGYEAEATRSLLTFALSLDEALDLVSSFIDPILARTAEGFWNPNRRGWFSERYIPL